MIDMVVSWVWAHPLQSVGIMTAIGVLAGALALRPELVELLNRNHPRC